MPKVVLTYHEKAEAKVDDLKTLCMGVKTMKRISWDVIADEMLIPRSTLVYRFNNNLFTLSEWYEFLHVLGIEKGNIEL